MLLRLHYFHKKEYKDFASRINIQINTYFYGKSVNNEPIDMTF